MDAARDRHDASVVEIDLEAKPNQWKAAPGATVAGYAYNGRVPGPTLEARRGDTLVVRFTNRLPEPTTIHWHGLRVPAEIDGTESAQRPVNPGEQFEYRFQVPDAGTFWYHPHINETVQMELGLYGAIVVRGDDEPVLDAEKLLIFDDLHVGRDGSLARFGGHNEQHEGRLGNILLLNGRADPELTVSAGQVERWRLVNAGSSRYVLVSLGGRTFRLLASDGGLLANPAIVDKVLLTPGERADLAVGPFAEGDEIPIDGAAYDRGHGPEPGGRYALARVGPPAPSIARIPKRLRDIELIAPADSPANRILRLTERMDQDGIVFGINGEAHYPDAPVRVGDLQVWDIVNETGMDHPFHLHGFFFQVLRINGPPVAQTAWKDTVNVPARGTVTIAWRAEDRPGGWMYHCHILEHHALGMTGHFEVVQG